LAATEPEVAKLAILPDVSIQAMIRAYSEAKTPAEADEKLQDIRKICDASSAQLISQLLLYAATSPNEQWARSQVGRILEDMRIPKEAAILALVPQLDNVNPLIQQSVRSLLNGYEDSSATRPPDFSTYRAIIESTVRAREEPQISLVKHMYHTDPGAALLAMMRGYQLRDPNELRPILWAEHVIAEMFWKRQHGFIKPQEVPESVAHELDSLSRSDRWWARLYVGALSQRSPELRRPEIVRRLKDDQNPHVRESVAGI
jgi:hypothetical protein